MLEAIQRWPGKIGAAVAGFIAVMLMFRLAKNAWEYIKGQGSSSIWKILMDVAIMALMIGFVYIAMNPEALGQTAQNVGQQAIDIASDTATELTNP